jgi:hypothetical protein
MAATADPWDLGGTYTRDQILHMRGDLHVGNGAADLAVPVPNGKHAQPATEMSECSHGENRTLRPCQGCGEPLDGPDTKRWCSQTCRARYRRAHPETFVGGFVASVEHDETSSTPFDQLAAVASLLPAGWRLEATASTVVVSWSP